MTLHLHAWGAEDAPTLVCLHGVTAHGRRFRRVAEEHLASFRVLAPDLRGHGFSPYEPPWSVEQHLEDVLATVGDAPRIWLGHSFGGRLVFELAARYPERVDRLVLLDPALYVLPHVAFDMAELERQEVAFAMPEEAIHARLESGRVFHTPMEILEEEMEQHLDRHPADGLLRFRYCKSTVIAAWSTMATSPPAFPKVPTLLVIGEQSWLLLDEQAVAYKEALGDLLQVVHVPGGHTVLWDALDQTASAVSEFLAS
jgi:lipase